VWRSLFFSFVDGFLISFMDYGFVLKEFFDGFFFVVDSCFFDRWLICWRIVVFLKDYSLFVGLLFFLWIIVFYLRDYSFLLVDYCFLVGFLFLLMDYWFFAWIMGVSKDYRFWFLDYCFFGRFLFFYGLLTFLWIMILLKDYCFFGGLMVFLWIRVVFVDGWSVCSWTIGALKDYRFLFLDDWFVGGFFFCVLTFVVGLLICFNGSMFFEGVSFFFFAEYSFVGDFFFCDALLVLSWIMGMFRRIIFCLAEYCFLFFCLFCYCRRILDIS